MFPISGEIVRSRTADNADLGEVLCEELAPFGQRLVMPIKERDVGDLPTESSEKS